MTRLLSTRSILFAVLVVALTGVPAGPPDAAGVVAAVGRDPAVRRALGLARTIEKQTLDDQIRFCEVPAPPFKETARGELLRRAFADAGLRNVRVDAAGNVLGDRGGEGPRPRLVMAAHLDTVFPEETAVAIRREGNTLVGPGIGDNCRGLAVLVATARALQQAAVRTPGSMTFVANVGEEGLGDLRGVKALFGETMKNQIDRFVSIDNAGIHLSTIGVGSLRYRFTFKGPGGHSYAQFGMPNPANALGRAIAKISELQVASTPRTTFNVGRIGGGTSVNSVPSESWMEIDLRSTDQAALQALDSRVRQVVDDAVREENIRWRQTGSVTVARELVGERVAGSIATDAPIVQIALAVARKIGVAVSIGESSSDANLPLSLKIPAITIGGGGRSWHSHALDETFDVSDAWKGTENAVLLAVSLTR